jgi:hypothetical protein
MVLPRTVPNRFFAFLDEVNQGLPNIHVENTRKFALLPMQEYKTQRLDIWLQAKTWVRRFCALIPSFSHSYYEQKSFLDCRERAFFLPLDP